ncbi:MAG: hypothetical protein QGG39_16885, partial [Candidatus Poribacteria bacterium]|nr:hypothetical protein [Candidatus Poribacteria bacterium]
KVDDKEAPDNKTPKTTAKHVSGPEMARILVDHFSRKGVMTTNSEELGGATRTAAIDFLSSSFPRRVYEVNSVTVIYLGPENNNSTGVENNNTEIKSNNNTETENNNNTNTNNSNNNNTANPTVDSVQLPPRSFKIARFRRTEQKGILKTLRLERIAGLEMFPVAGLSYLGLPGNQLLMVYQKVPTRSYNIDPSFMASIREGLRIQYAGTLAALDGESRGLGQSALEDFVAKELLKGGRVYSKPKIRAVILDSKRFRVTDEGLLLIREKTTHRWLVVLPNAQMSIVKHGTPERRNAGCLQVYCGERHAATHLKPLALALEVQRRGFGSDSLYPVSIATVRDCLHCLMATRPIENRARVDRTESWRLVGQVILIDWITNLPPSSSGNTSIVTSCDGVSTNMLCKAFDRATAKRGAEHLESILDYSQERYAVIRSDSGSHFQSEFEERVVSLYKAR